MLTGHGRWKCLSDRRRSTIDIDGFVGRWQ